VRDVSFLLMSRRLRAANMLFSLVAWWRHHVCFQRTKGADMFFVYRTVRVTRLINRVQQYIPILFLFVAQFVGDQCIVLSDTQFLSSIKQQHAKA
jgi:hypothetical protein